MSNSESTGEQVELKEVATAPLNDNSQKTVEAKEPSPQPEPQNDVSPQVQGEFTIPLQNAEPQLEQQIVPIQDEPTKPKSAGKKKKSAPKKSETPKNLYFSIVVLIVNALLFICGLILIGWSIYALAFATQVDIAHNSKKASYVQWVPILTGVVFLVTSVLGFISAVVYKFPRVRIVFGTFFMMGSIMSFFFAIGAGTIIPLVSLFADPNNYNYNTSRTARSVLPVYVIAGLSLGYAVCGGIETYIAWIQYYQWQAKIKMEASLGTDIKEKKRLKPAKKLIYVSSV